MNPTVYLGLGGTGNLAISYAKKLYEEEFGVGNIPSHVAFFAVDFYSDMDVDAGLSTDIKDNFIKIDFAANLKDFYRVRREQHGQYTWMFEGNLSQHISLMWAISLVCTKIQHSCKMLTRRIFGMLRKTLQSNACSSVVSMVL